VKTLLGLFGWGLLAAISVVYAFLVFMALVSWTWTYDEPHTYIPPDDLL